jgi:hypothetical protein
MTFSQALSFMVLFSGIFLVPVLMFGLQFSKTPQPQADGWHDHQPQGRHQRLIKLESVFYFSLGVFMLYLIYMISQATIQDPEVRPWKWVLYLLFGGINILIVWSLYHVYQLYRAYKSYEKDSYLLISYREHKIQYVRRDKTYEIGRDDILTLTYYCYVTTWRRSPLTNFERYEFELRSGEKVMITNWLLDVNSHVLDDVLNIRPDKTVTGIRGLYLFDRDAG